MIHKRKYIIRVKRIIPFNISYELIDYSEKGNISKDKKELIQLRYHVITMIREYEYITMKKRIFMVNISDNENESKQLIYQMLRMK